MPSTAIRVHTLDLAFHGVREAIACYLVVGPGGPVLIETGPASAYATLVARLAEHGFAPGDVRDALVTHIHLDHAGAAGHLAEGGTRIHVHPVGAPHLVDPSRLLASAARIYGADMDRLWGETRAVPAGQVNVLADGETIEPGGVAITPVDTPGHAGHHFAYRVGDAVFAGDVAGVRLPGRGLVSLPAPPPEFDLEAWDASLDRLTALAPARLYLTHFGPFDDATVHLAELRELLHDSAAFIRAGLDEGLDREALVERYTAWNHARAAGHGIPDDVVAAYGLANPLAMTVDGITRYWRKRGREGSVAG